MKEKLILSACEVPVVSPRAKPLPGHNPLPSGNTRPFFIEGPAVISFSGGRTSAYMLRRILDEGLQNDVFVVFADTGLERKETYDFVNQCSINWNIKVHWVSYPKGEFDTPFEAIIKKRKYLPNPVTRFRTQEMKINRIRDFMRARGFSEKIKNKIFYQF